MVWCQSETVCCLLFPGKERAANGVECFSEEDDVVVTLAED